MDPFCRGFLAPLLQISLQFWRFISIFTQRYIFFFTNKRLFWPKIYLSNSKILKRILTKTGEIFLCGKKDTGIFFCWKDISPSRLVLLNTFLPGILSPGAPSNYILQQKDVVLKFPSFVVHTPCLKGEFEKKVHCRRNWARRTALEI